ncbi:Dynein heavy chain [Glycine soja]
MLGADEGRHGGHERTDDHNDGGHDEHEEDNGGFNLINYPTSDMGGPHFVQVQNKHVFPPYGLPPNYTPPNENVNNSTPILIESQQPQSDHAHVSQPMGETHEIPHQNLANFEPHLGYAIEGQAVSDIPLQNTLEGPQYHPQPHPLHSTADTLPVFYYEKMMGYAFSSFANLVFAGERIEAGLKRGKFDHHALTNEKTGANEEDENEGETLVVTVILTRPNFPLTQQCHYSASINPSHYPPPNHPQRLSPNQPQGLPTARPMPNTTFSTNQNTNQEMNFAAKKPIEFTPIPTVQSEITRLARWWGCRKTTSKTMIDTSKPYTGAIRGTVHEPQANLGADQKFLPVDIGPLEGYTSLSSEGCTSSPPEGYTSSPSKGYMSSPLEGYTSSPLKGCTSSAFRGLHVLAFRGLYVLALRATRPRLLRATCPRLPRATQGYTSSPSESCKSSPSEGYTSSPSEGCTSSPSESYTSLPPKGCTSSTFRGLHVLAFRGLHVLASRGLYVLAFRGLHVLAFRGLYVLAFGGLHVLDFRRLRVLAFRGLYILAFRGLHVLASRGLYVLAFRGLHFLTFSGLHVLNFRGLDVLTFRGLYVLAFRGLHILTSKGLHVLAFKGLHVLASRGLYVHSFRGYILTFKGLHVFAFRGLHVLASRELKFLGHPPNIGGPTVRAQPKEEAGITPTRHPVDSKKSNRVLGFPALITGLFQFYGFSVAPNKVIRPPINKAFIEKYCAPKRAQGEAPQ